MTGGPGAVANAIEAGRFWVFPNPDWVDIAVRRWHTIAEFADPELEMDVPGLPPAAETTMGSLRHPAVAKGS